MSTLQRIWFFILLSAVTILALLLRLRAAETLPIDYDEDDYLAVAVDYSSAIRRGEFAEIVNYDYNLEHPPLSKLVYGIALLALPETQPIKKLPSSAPIASSLPNPHFIVTRTISVILGTLEVCVLGLLNPIAGLFLAVNTWQIKYTSQIMLEPLPALLSLIVVYGYYKSRRGWGFWLVLSAVSFGLSIAAKYPYGIVGVAIILDWLWMTRPISGRSGSSRLMSWIKPVLIWGVIVVLIFLMFNPRMWINPVDRLFSTVSFHFEYAQSNQVAQAGLPVWQPLVWLSMSVPWHPGVFIVSIDFLITLLALIGFRQLWSKYRVFALWLSIAIGFLLIWPTKWPQYILILTAPLSLSAAEGIKSLFGPVFQRPTWNLDEKVRSYLRRQTLRRNWEEILHAFPWLMTGTTVLALIAIYPMLYQGAMSLTDFSSAAIRDGLNGGVWREAWNGLTGQVEAAHIRLFSPSHSKQVQYTGPILFLQLLGGGGAGLLVFNTIWTVLSVLGQTALGLGVALILNQVGLYLKGWWRVIYILPWAIPEFVGALIWAQVFDPRFGWANQAARTWYERADYPGAINLISNWQENPNIALVVLLIAGIWFGFPFMMLAATAGLKMIPDEVYDAAAIDGAAGWDLFRFITWPMLLPLLAPAIIIRSIFAFNQFYLFYVLRPPNPLSTFATTSFYFFDQFGQYSVSAVINIFTVLVLVVILIFFNRWSNASEGVTYA
jgi:ABC-type sugar transport system permease subunit